VLEAVNKIKIEKINLAEILKMKGLSLIMIIYFWLLNYFPGKHLNMMKFRKDCDFYQSDI
jgi:hypothetical protein